MSFDEVMIWLVTAMSLTAVAFLCWTLVAVIRRSGSTAFGVGVAPERHLSGLASHDHRSARL